MTPVIVAAPSQHRRVARLVEHCRRLDDTEVLVLDGGPDCALPYPHCNNAAFHQAALAMRGKPFCWLEPDSIPLQKGWLKAISQEYKRAGKPFMLSSDSNPPHDLVGGIGVYGPDSWWLIPKTYKFGAWDLWIITHLRPLIHFSPLIQHSYGIPWDVTHDFALQIQEPKTLV